ncbi:ABC transporter permease [Streptosporangium sp. NPDC051022]|uniref:ABC transporter permease n=1 Tax=Streptosporangium sp. NPDC051022 TaxID=3155752 RepID=UPI00341F3CF0
MALYTLRRLLSAVPAVVLIVSALFFIVRVLPGDPARAMAGPDASAEQLENIRRLLGTDRPLLEQYVRFLFDLLRGSLGNSAVSGAPVWSEIDSRLPYTLVIAVTAIVIAIAAGVLLGVLAAVRRGTWLDAAISALAVLGLSLPAYWLGTLMILVFAVWMGLLPSGGTNSPSSIILPSVVLATFPLGVIVRITRSSLLGVLGQDYMRTARAKGVPPYAAITGHALRNALLPIVTMIGMLFASMLGGSVITETVFSWPGIGRLLVDSILSRDYPVIVGVVFVFSLIVLLINLVTDLLYGLIDPKVRYD